MFNHMSNTIHNFLDTALYNDSKNNDDAVKHNMFNCLSYTFLLSNLDRMIDSSRLLLKLIHTSHLLYGAEHGCTQAAELALQQKKLRFVICEHAGKACVFRIVRYVDEEMESCVLQGPCAGGGVSSRDDDIGKQPPLQQQTILPSKSIIPTLGTPVICHNCITPQTHLNGKIGDVRSINRLTNECQVHFESVTMEPQFVKASNLRVLFDLPPCQNLDYKFYTDEVIGERYRLVERVGKGAFGQVVKAVDTQRNDEEVAIKIIKRSGPKQNFFLQAQTEIGLLRRIEEMQEGLGMDNHIGRLHLFWCWELECSCCEMCVSSNLVYLLADIII